ncbi:MAG: Fic family protein [Synergistes sp.]|nr:Fic family protein [Synergistes sp.]
MKYLSVSETAKKWGVSERTVRNYCAEGRIPEAFITGKTWNIPESAVRPARASQRSYAPKNLLEFLRAEKAGGIRGGIYHKVQIEFTYNSNHMEGSRLTHDQTRYIYETDTVGVGTVPLRTEDILETVNHFRCIDLVIDYANRTLSEGFIKLLHLTLKNGTGDSRKRRFAVGAYKTLPNEVGGRETALPEEVPGRIKTLLRSYNAEKEKTLEEMIAFHFEFETIHPFQDGNGRVGRLILFKECLRNGVVPFIIDEDLKMFYYRGLSEWRSERGFLLETCLSAQDKFKAYLDYFRVPYKE